MKTKRKCKREFSLFNLYDEENKNVKINIRKKSIETPKKNK